MSNLQAQIIKCLAVFGTATAAFGQTTSIRLPQDNPVSQIKAAAGDDKVRGHCALCHSTDYIVRQPHLDQQHWDAEVNKMITAYGARISETDAKIIVDYLLKNYGAQAEPKKSSSPN